MYQDIPVQYFLIIDNKQAGPFTLDELILHRSLTPESMVWKTGLENWMPASTFPELAPAFSATPFNEPGRFGGGERPGADPNRYGGNIPPGADRYNEHSRYSDTSPHGNPYYNNPHHQEYRDYRTKYEYPGRDERYREGPQRYHTNWLPWAIVATVVGFFTSCIGAIFGIVGIVQANKANTMYAQGFYREGDAANSTAKIMSIIGLIFAGLGILVLLFFYGSLGSIGGFGY